MTLWSIGWIVACLVVHKEVVGLNLIAQFQYLEKQIIFPSSVGKNFKMMYGIFILKESDIFLELPRMKFNFQYPGNETSHFVALI